MAKFRNLKGQKFNRLLVIKRVENGECGLIRWLCLCDCGNKVIVFSGNLIKGRTQSCGCYQKERASEANIIHGFAAKGKTIKEYRIWASMIERCTNKNNKRFKDYGGRGIKVCDRWRNSFTNFYNDMGPCPKGWTIERIDNNGNYCPDNCKWATQYEQVRNKRSNRWIEFDGRKMILEDWAKEIGINSKILNLRLNQRGWSVERALTTPAKQSIIG